MWRREPNERGLGIFLKVKSLEGRKAAGRFSLQFADAIG